MTCTVHLRSFYLRVLQIAGLSFPFLNILALRWDPKSMSYKHQWDLDQCLPELKLGKNVGFQSRGCMRCANLECTVQTGFILSQALNSDNIQFSQGFFSLFCIVFPLLVFLSWYLSSSQTSDLVPDQPLFFISCQKQTSFS